MTLPARVFRVYATYNPKAQPPVKFTTMASFAYELRERAEAYQAELVDKAARETRRTPPTITDRFGVTIYVVREEDRNGASVVLGQDEEMTDP